jgi:hypothetical protein
MFAFYHRPRLRRWRTQQPVSISKIEGLMQLPLALKNNRLPFAVLPPLSFDSGLATGGSRRFQDGFGNSRILKTQTTCGLTNQIVKEQNERVSRSVENASASERSC